MCLKYKKYKKKLHIYNFYNTNWSLSEAWAFELVVQSLDKNKWRVGGSQKVPDPNFLDLSKTCCDEVFQTWKYTPKIISRLVGGVHSWCLYQIVKRHVALEWMVQFFSKQIVGGSEGVKKPLPLFFVVFRKHAAMKFFKY